MDYTTLSSLSLTSTLVNDDDITSLTSHLETGFEPPSSEVQRDTVLPDEELWEDETRERHDDHWDIIDFFDPWQDEYRSDWWNYGVQKHDDSVTNDALYESENTQKWMEALARPGRESRSILLHPRPETFVGTISIPLFKGINGWEYQVCLDGGIGPPLPGIYCPSVLAERGRPANLFKLVPRAGPGQNQIHKLPRFLLTLGTLMVRNNARTGFIAEGYRVTEPTDYCVFVDIGDENMPVWLFASRPQLRGRLENPWHIEPVRHLPMFGGLLEERKEAEKTTKKNEKMEESGEMEEEYAIDDDKKECEREGAREDGNMDEKEEERAKKKEEMKDDDTTPDENKPNQNGGLGYDSGCILPAVRRLATRMSDERSLEAFHEACGLLRETRGIVDPAGLYLPEVLDNEFIMKGIQGLAQLLES